MADIRVNHIKAIGFDLDGTLYKANDEIFNHIQEYIARRAAKILGREYEEVKREFDINYAEFQSASKSLEKMNVAYPESIVQDALEKADVASILSKDKRLVALIDKLRLKRRVFMITSSPNRDAIKKIKALGLNHNVFHPFLCAEESIQKKVSRRDHSAFRYISSMLNADFSEMMFVGDREGTDIIPAKELGITTAIVNAKSEHADYQLKSIYDLVKIFF